MAVVLLTDFAWPDDRVERALIEAAGHVLIAGRSEPGSAAEIEARVAEHDPEAIMTCWAQVSAAAIRRATRLRIVQRLGVGMDNIAVEAATARGAWVANVPDYCVGEVADHAVALLLGWARGVTAFDRQVHSGLWNPSAAKLRRVSDLVVGLIGWGPIAQATAARLKAFSARLLVHSPSGRGGDGVEPVGLPTLLDKSDVVVLHAPLNDRTRHLIDAERLSAMKPGAYLINVSRGGLVETAALVAALQSGRLSGAGLDVVEDEPNVPRALLDHPGVTVTPHVAFSSEASLIELRRRAAEDVLRALAGAAPRHPCNQPQGRP